VKGIQRKGGEIEKEERELPCNLNVLKKYYSFVMYSLAMFSLLLKREEQMKLGLTESGDSKFILNKLYIVNTIHEW
jgi:hypothetical protein